MNLLAQDKVDALEMAAASGLSPRKAAREIGVSKNTAAKYIAMFEAPTLCQCGQPMKHRGWCKFRFDKSQARQVFMAVWGSRKLEDLRGIGRVRIKKNNNKFLNDSRENGRATMPKVRSGVGNFVNCSMVVSKGVQHCCVCSELVGINDYYLSVGEMHDNGWTAWRFCWKCAHSSVATAFVERTSRMSDLDKTVLLQPATRTQEGSSGVSQRRWARFWKWSTPRFVIFLQSKTTRPVKS